MQIWDPNFCSVFQYIYITYIFLLNLIEILYFYRLWHNVTEALENSNLEKATDEKHKVGLNISLFFHNSKDYVFGIV